MAPRVRTGADDPGQVDGAGAPGVAEGKATLYRGRVVPVDANARTSSSGGYEAERTRPYGQSGRWVARCVRMRIVTGVILICTLTLAAQGCSGGDRDYVEVPNNHNYQLDEALRRLNVVGLRATYDAVSVACGMGVPYVNAQTPRAPARVRRGSIIKLKFQPTPIPSPVVPKKRPRWAYVPQLVGEDASVADQLRAMWPCLHVRPAGATSATRLVVVEQDPAAGTRVPAYGVRARGGGWRPTAVTLVVAAR